MSKKLLMLTCASSALSVWAGASCAATASNTTAADQGGTAVTEIVVVAEKREQVLQKTPVAVAVFTGNERDVIGLQSIQDVSNFTPGFTYDPVEVHAYIRGVGREDPNLTDDPRVATYEDGLFVPYPYNLDKSSLFLSQAQVELGPQNVGYKEAEGGSIDEISVRPTDTPYAEVRAAVGNFGTYNFEGAASGQVAPGLDVRVAAYDKNQDDGYYNNVANGVSEGNVIHEWYVEGQADWKPNDKAELWLHANTGEWSNRGDAGSRAGFSLGDWDETNLTDANAYEGGSLYANPNFGYAALEPGAQAAALANPANLPTLDPALGPYVPTKASLLTPGITNNPSLADENDFAATSSESVRLESYATGQGIFTYDFSGMQLKYIAGYQQYAYKLSEYPSTDVTSYTMGLAGLGGLGDVEGLPALAINPGGLSLRYIENDNYWDNELSLQSTTDSPLQWTVGGFFYQQHYSNPITINAPDQPQVADPMSVNAFDTLLGGLLATGNLSQFLTGTLTSPRLSNPNNYLYYTNYDLTYQDTSGYAQVSYKLNDQFKISGDIRYSYDRKWGWEEDRDVEFNSSFIDIYGPFLGADTPAVDVTTAATCPSGVASRCTSGAPGNGVTSYSLQGPGGYVTNDLAAISSAVTGGAGVEWTPTSDIFIYAKYERGYAAATLNAGTVVADPVVQPEYLNAYEAGYKETFGKNLLIDVEGFYYDYDGMQLPVSVSVDGILQGQFINVPKAVSTGVDFTAYWAPVENLLVTLVYSFDYTAITTKCYGTVSGGVLTPATGALCLVDTNDPDAVEPGANPYPGQTPGTTRDQGVNGDPLPNAPENKLGLDVAYTWHFTPGAFTASGAFIYRDSQEGSIFDRYYNTAPAWTGVNVRGIWKSPGDRYEIIGFVDNVFNSNQYLTGASGAGLLGNIKNYTSAQLGYFEATSYEIGPPRTFGVEVRYKFF